MLAEMIEGIKTTLKIGDEKARQIARQREADKKLVATKEAEIDRLRQLSRDHAELDRKQKLNQVAPHEVEAARQLYVGQTMRVAAIKDAEDRLKNSADVGVRRQFMLVNRLCTACKTAIRAGEAKLADLQTKLEAKRVEVKEQLAKLESAAKDARPDQRQSIGEQIGELDLSMAEIEFAITMTEAELEQLYAKLPALESDQQAAAAKRFE